MDTFEARVQFGYRLYLALRRECDKRNMAKAERISLKLQRFAREDPEANNEVIDRCMEYGPK